jgi:hypothetical protein
MSKDFPKSGHLGPDMGYCLHCKGKHHIDSGHVEMRKGRRYMIGKCSKCHHGIARSLPK